MKIYGLDVEEMLKYDWSVSMWAKAAWSPGRVSYFGMTAHAQGPRPQHDRSDREAKWPALCGVDLRYGSEVDVPIHTVRLRPCARCVAIIKKAAS